MKQVKLTAQDAARQISFGLQFFTSKAEGFDQVTSMPASELAKFKKQISRLTTYEIEEEAFWCLPAHLTCGLFIAKVKETGRKYIIDCQGYDYARYATRM